MNNYNINDSDFLNSELYQNFKNINNGIGWLKIRIYKASEAVPIEGVKVNIYTTFQNQKIFFYQGETDNSGTIEKISLPAPNIENDLIAPPTIIYTIEIAYENIKETYDVRVYEGVCVMQSINLNTDIVNNRRGFIWL